MSSIPEEELAKIMRPGLRVVRGKDWQGLWRIGRSVLEDGNGVGTITKIDRNLCYVKWDHDGSEFYYCQGPDGIFRLKLAEEKALESKKLKNLPERLFKKKDFLDAKIICQGKTFECHKIV